MTALLVLNYDVTDQSRLDSYRSSAHDVILGPNGRLVTSTESTTDLGEGPMTGSRTVVIEFPSSEEAEALYRSHAYQALLPERISATIPRSAFIVDVTESGSDQVRSGRRPRLRASAAG